MWCERSGRRSALLRANNNGRGSQPRKPVLKYREHILLRSITEYFQLSVHPYIFEGFLVHIDSTAWMEG